ncbi:hypothetical protein LTR17_014101 [Elasticomyces elasticus]|nr:hypothetical protein LTR17_014101 [Elasticomyces elasticus]
MFLCHLILAGLCASVQCAPLHEHGNNLLRSLNLPIDEAGATAFSLIYGAPLQQFRQLASTSGILKGEGSNALGSHYTTATASVRNVVRPNVDTIYATGIFDLSATDLVVTLPPMEEDRFYLFGFYDPPNPIGTLLIRVEVKDNDTDVSHVASYLSNSTLATVNPHAASHPPLTLTDFADLSNSTVLSTLQLTARLQSRATPESAAFQHKVPAILALAGIRNGSYNQPNGVNMTLAAELAKAATTAFTKAPSSYPDLGNGWSMMNNSYSGTFELGTAFIPRAITAAALYLQVTPANALYPTLGSTQTSLTEGEAYVFTFSGRPPVADSGFWSLTMYDDSGYLVANSENTWAVGDRSNITFADGGLVYGNGTADGSFQVLVQDAGIPPPTNWTSNWLPAPSGGGSSTVTFRLYAPTDALSDGSYVYPLVEKVDAITA